MIELMTSLSSSASAQLLMLAILSLPDFVTTTCQLIKEIKDWGPSGCIVHKLERTCHELHAKL